MKNLNEQIKRINQLNNRLTPTRGFAEPADATYVRIKNPIFKSQKFEPTKKRDLDFETITDLTIKNLEGGYYSPKLGIKGMGDSGETLFGMDRKHGVSFTNSPQGKEFWRLVDEDKKKNPKRWKYDYRLGDNPELKGKLIDLIVNKFLKPDYESFSNTFFRELPIAKKIVNNDPRLKFHMSYAVWNGSGWFQTFANKLMDAIKNKGITNADDLAGVAIDSRINSGNKYIKAKADEIKTIFDGLV